MEMKLSSIAIVCANYQFYSVNFDSKLNEINQKFLINSSSIISSHCTFYAGCFVGACAIYLATKYCGIENVTLLSILMWIVLWH